MPLGRETSDILSDTKRVRGFLFFFSRFFTRVDRTRGCFESRKKYKYKFVFHTVPGGNRKNRCTKTVRRNLMEKNLKETTAYTIIFVNPSPPLSVRWLYRTNRFRRGRRNRARRIPTSWTTIKPATYRKFATVKRTKSLHECARDFSGYCRMEISESDMV